MSSDHYSATGHSFVHLPTQSKSDCKMKHRVWDELVLSIKPSPTAQKRTKVLELLLFLRKLVQAVWPTTPQKQQSFELTQSFCAGSLGQKMSELNRLLGRSVSGDDFCCNQCNSLEQMRGQSKHC